MLVSTYAQQLTVFAASSLTDAMKILVMLWTRGGHSPLRMSFASATTLARQIWQGALANLVTSADEKWMDNLAERT